MISWHCSRTYKFSHFGTTEFFPFLGVVGTYLCARIPSTLFAVIECWKEHWFNFQIWIFIEYLMRGQWFIIIAYTSVIPANNEVSTSKILAHYCMMNCFLWSCISHLCMKSNKHRTAS